MRDIFYAWFKGKGEGCDYTIGCNEQLRRLNATDMTAAEDEACGDWSEYDNERVERITILRVTEEHDCAAHIALLRAEREAKEAAMAKASKRAEFERLKRELGEA